MLLHPGFKPDDVFPFFDTTEPVTVQKDRLNLRIQRGDQRGIIWPTVTAKLGCKKTANDWLSIQEEALNLNHHY